MIFWLSSALALLQGGQAMTLQEAVDYAVRHSFSVQVAKSNIDKAGFTVQAAKGALGPSVDVSAYATRSDTKTSGGSGESGSFAGANETKQLQLSASMPIDISGNIRRSISAQGFAYEASKANLDAEINLVKSRVRAAYFAVLQAQALEQVYAETLANNQDRLTNSQQLLKAGVVANVNVINADTQVSRAKSDLIAAQNRLTLAKNSFNNTLARPIDTPVDLSEVQEVPLSNFDRSKLEKYAISSRPEIRSLAFTIQALEMVREAVKKGQAPNLNLSLTNTNSYFGSGFGNRSNGLSGGAFLNFNLYDSGVIRARAKAALEDENQARFNLEQLTLSVTLDVQQAITNLVDSNSRLEVATKQVELAKENYRLAMVRYKAGEGIQLETIDAQTELTRAQVGLVTARYDYLTAWADLQKAIGSDDLEAVNAPKTEPHEEGIKQ